MWSRLEGVALQSGKNASLEQLFAHHSVPIYSYLLRLSGNSMLADELTGETFYRAMLALDGFRGESTVRTWLLRIARNLYLRRSEREQRVTSLEALEDGGTRFPAEQPDPEEALVRKERSQSIQGALMSLLESDRSILLLSAQEGLRTREIADVLEISVTAAKVRLYRARRRLAEALLEYLP
jgi:RNA polymerase sigma factor (sigma-70 family)